MRHLNPAFALASPMIAVPSALTPPRYPTGCARGDLGKSASARIVLFASVSALLSLSILSLSMQAQNITTVAGGGFQPTSGTSFATGFATAVAVDPTSGNLYVSDATHSHVYSVDAHTGIPTIVGTGTPTTVRDDGALNGNYEWHPNTVNGLAADGKGHLYIADQLAGFVYEVNSSGGTLQVVAGCGTINNPACHGQQTIGDGVPATSAFLTPASVAVDLSGNLLISDTNSCRIRKVTAGTISTVAGSSTCGYSGDGMAATLAQLNYPQGIAVDRSGNIFIADTTNAVVREVCASNAGPCGGANKIRTIAGGGANDPSKGGPAIAASLSPPAAVSVDSAGNLYLTEMPYTNRVSLVNTSSSPIRIAPPTPSLPGCSSPVTPELVLPGGIQTLAGTLQSGYTSTGDCQTTPPEGIPAMYTTLNGAAGVAASGGVLLIADSANFRVRAVNLSGTPVKPFGIQQTIQPYYIRTVVGNGQEESITNGSSPTALQLGLPSAVAEDAALNIYISENPARILEVTSDGRAIKTIAGNGVLPRSAYSVVGDGNLAVAAELDAPGGLFLDNLDNVIIGDYTIQGVNTSDQSRTIYGTSVGAGDIQQLLPQTYAGNLTSNNASNLYLGQGDIIVGTNPSVTFGNFQGDADPAYPTPASTLGDKGPAADAIFGSINGQCLDGSGNLFITDGYTFDVRLIAIGSQASVGPITVQPNYIDSVAGNSGQLPPSTGGSSGYDRGFDHAYYTAEQIGDGGPATSAFVAPAGCFVDNLGNIFLADAGNDRIRRIDRTTGNISTVAGGQFPGFSGDGGPAVDASLNVPIAIWGDQAGNLLISDSGNHRIRKISGILPVPKATVSCAHCFLNNPSPGTVVQVTLTNTGSAPLILSAPPSLINSKDFSISTSGCGVGLPGLAPNATCIASVTSLGKTAFTAVSFYDNAFYSNAFGGTGVIAAPDPNRRGQSSGYVQSKIITSICPRH